MDEPRTEQATSSDNWELSMEEIDERVEEYYKPRKSEEERWFRCQRSVDDGTICGRKVFFPHGVVAHENHHSVKSGNGPLISQNQPDSPVPEKSGEPGHDSPEVDITTIESIQSEFEDME